MRRVIVEGLGTAFLLAAVVGSGIMGERLAGGNAAVALLANSLATGAVLFALIEAFGGHFNPLVTLVLAWRGQHPRKDVAPYLAAQVVGAFLGVWAAHYMFELPVLMTSRHARTGGPQWAGEVVATFGLLAVVLAGKPRAVAPYVMAAYWFTSSTSFANPAVTLARAFSDTFAGIRPVDVPGFLAAQAVGALLAAALFRPVVEKA